MHFKKTLRFSNVFRECRNGTLVESGLIEKQLSSKTNKYEYLTGEEV